MNTKSSVGLTEELLTNLINTVALEYHLRIAIEKYYSLLFIKNVEDENYRAKLESDLEFATDTLERTTEQRRGVMRALQSQATEEANPDLWCAVKHASVQMITMFEAWQVDMDNADIEALYHSSVELFNVVVAGFLGYFPQPCSACFADALQSQEELNLLVANLPEGHPLSEEVVMKRATEVFGNVPDALLETD